MLVLVTVVHADNHTNLTFNSTDLTDLNITNTTNETRPVVVEENITPQPELINVSPELINTSEGDDVVADIDINDIGPTPPDQERIIRYIVIAFIAIVIVAIFAFVLIWIFK